eukprot:5390142-Amphidinium_carterae.1
MAELSTGLCSLVVYNPGLKDFVASLIEAGCVEVDGDIVQLTMQGRALLTCTYLCQHGAGRQAAAIREGKEPEDMTRFELYESLISAGWSVQVVQSKSLQREAMDNPFTCNVAEPHRVIYVNAKQLPFKEYFLCLKACVIGGMLENQHILHLRPQRYYAALLLGKDGLEALTRPKRSRKGELDLLACDARNPRANSNFNPSYNHPLVAYASRVKNKKHLENNQASFRLSSNTNAFISNSCASNLCALSFIARTSSLAVLSEVTSLWVFSACSSNHSHTLQQPCRSRPQGKRGARRVRKLLQLQVEPTTVEPQDETDASSDEGVEEPTTVEPQDETDASSDEGVEDQEVQGFDADTAGSDSSSSGSSSSSSSSSSSTVAEVLLDPTTPLAQDTLLDIISNYLFCVPSHMNCSLARTTESDRL